MLVELTKKHFGVVGMKNFLIKIPLVHEHQIY